MSKKARNLINNFKCAKLVKSTKKRKVIATDDEYQLLKAEMKKFNAQAKTSKKGKKKGTQQKARIIYIGKYHS